LICISFTAKNIENFMYVLTIYTSYTVKLISPCIGWIIFNA
jgi:hypothetical protein